MIAFHQQCCTEFITYKMCMPYLRCILFIYLLSSFFAVTAQQPFPLATAKRSASLVLSENEFAGVQLAARNLQADIQRVAGAKPQIQTMLPREKDIVLVGTIGKNGLLDKLIDDKKIEVSAI